MILSLLFVAGQLFALMATYAFVSTTVSVLVIASSLVPVAVSGTPVLTAMILTESTTLTQPPSPTSAAVEVTTSITATVDLASPSLSLQSASTSPEQMNATVTGGQHTQLMQGMGNNGSLSHSTIVALVVCPFLFFALLLAIYLWYKYYPPRPGSRPTTDQPGGDLELYQTRAVSSTANYIPPRLPTR